MWRLQRTHTCGALRAADAGGSVTLNGWVDAVRDHGGLTFVELRDREGKTQVLIDRAVHPDAPRLRPESVVAVRGAVRRRAPENVNPRLPTGEIEVAAEEIELLNEARTPPFEIRDDLEAAEEIRMKYRYLDLRRPTVQRRFRLRHQMVAAIHEACDAAGFVELETPQMIKSTPGGARNFLIPSRLFPGQFFALPESPQIFKQLFMVSGFDKYYQIARCFRDEDLRADRQLEFTQLDIEMSFVRPDDVMAQVEAIMAAVMQRVHGVSIPRPFPRLAYEEAMARYGTDKPDLRFGWELADVTDEARGSDFKIFQSAACVKALSVPGRAGATRKQIDAWEAMVKGLGAGGMIHAKVQGGVQCPIAKYAGAERLERMARKAGAREGDLVLMVADEPERAALALGALRLRLWEEQNPTRPAEWKFCWVTDFPLFEKSEEGRVVSRHHPFTSPRPEDLDRMERAPLEAKALAYDLVLNGVELGGGSIRIHRRDVQRRIFSILGLGDQEIGEKFQFLLEAFEYGAPPHGGIALGIDRMAMLLSGADSIRDVIAFPKTQRTQCLMTGAPAPVTEAQLRELNLRVPQP
jgi:aspartyl-tRNA synthetase